MIPVMIDPGRVSIAVIGDGKASRRRLRLLKAFGAEAVTVFAPEASDEMTGLAPVLERRWPETADFAALDMVWIADVEAKTAHRLTEAARAAGVLVNTEDVLPLCDFHNVATVRRGDLVLAVSTRAKAPRLARRVREYLEEKFPPEWAERVAKLERNRAALKEKGATMDEIAAEIDAIIDRNGWLK